MGQELQVVEGSTVKGMWLFRNIVDYGVLTSVSFLLGVLFPLEPSTTLKGPRGQCHSLLVFVDRKRSTVVRWTIELVHSGLYDDTG